MIEYISKWNQGPRGSLGPFIKKNKKVARELSI